MAKRVRTVSESKTGRNKTFKDNKTGRYMSQKQFVKAIENGSYPNYHVRLINGQKTPVSNPDSSSNNNLD